MVVECILYHCERGKGLWLQWEAASQAHSFRDAEPHPVISPKQRKIMKYFESSSDHVQKPAFPPMTSVFLALHDNEVVFVTTESVAFDLQIRQNIPCY